MANPGSSVGVVIDEENEEDISYCSTCMAVGELVRLKERIYLDDKGKRLPDPPDSDNFKQCWTCGNIVTVSDIKKQGKIAGIQGIEILDNPYNEKKGVILGTDSRLGDRVRKLKRRQSKHQDKEVQAYLDKGYELTSYLNSMPT
jgi:hypothetical protein